MRKIYHSMMLIAAVAMASVSCQKQENAGGTDGPVVKMSVIASLDDVTRTSVAPVSGGYSVSWSAGDKIKILETLGGELTANVVNSDALAADADVASFSATLAVIQGTGFTYCAVYPSTAYSTGGTDTKFCRVNLPDAQTFTTAGFDPKADLLLGEARPYETQPSEVKLNFNRIGGTALMTLTGITEGEEISKIEISTTETNIAGFYKIDETTGMVIVPQMGSPVYSGSKTITLTCADELCAVASIPVWFRIAAAKLVEDFTVKVTTDKAIYDKTIDLAGSGRNIEFKDGFLTKFTVDLSGSREAVSTTVYNLVTDASELAAGDVIRIACSSKSKAAGALSGDFLTAEDATIENGKLTSNEAVDFTLGGTPSAWTLTCSDGTLGATAAKKLSFSGGTTTWTISIEDGKATIASTTGSYGRFLYNSGSPRFGNYTSATNASMLLPEIYKLQDSRTPLATPVISASADDEAKSITVSWTDVANAASYVVSCTGQTDRTVASGVQTCTFTDLEAGTYTVTVLAVAAAGYRNSFASAGNLVITAPASDALQTMDEIFAAATAAGSTATDVSVRFGNWTVSALKGTSNAYVTDGTKGFILYASGHGFAVGDILSGTVACKVQLYQGSAEITNLKSTTSGLTVTRGGVITPQNMSIASLSGVNTGAVISLGMLTFDGLNFTDGTNTIQPYNSLYTYPTLISGKRYDVKGVYLQYNSTREILPRSADDLVMEVSTEPEIYSVSPDALTFTATETTAKTVTITGANLTTSNVTLSLNNSDFTAQFGADAYTVNVAPKAANTSTTADKTATLTITVGSASKTVSITQSKAGAAEKTVVFDYPSLYPTVTGSASCDVSEDTVGDISVSYVKVSGSNPPKYYANGTNLRIYNQSTMTFTSSAGNITEVDFGQGTTTWASGKMAADTGSLNDSAKKWTGNAKTITFTVTGSFRFTKICVKYQ